MFVSRIFGLLRCVERIDMDAGNGKKHFDHFWKITRPRVNFINILRGAFTRRDPKSTKKDSQVKQLFALLGSLGVKAACKMLIKFTTGGNLIKLH